MRYLFILLAMAGPAAAQNTSMALQLPNPPLNYQSDRFRAGDLECSAAIGGGTNLEFGVFGGIAEDTFHDTTNDVGVYARIVIPLDGPNSRLDCAELYDLELRYRRLEVMRLEAELNQLRQLQAAEPEPDATPSLEFEF